MYMLDWLLDLLEKIEDGKINIDDMIKTGQESMLIYKNEGVPLSIRKLITNN